MINGRSFLGEKIEMTKERICAQFYIKKKKKKIEMKRMNLSSLEENIQGLNFTFVFAV